MSQVRLAPNHVCDKDTGRYKARVRSLEAKSLGTLEIDKTQGPAPPHTMHYFSFLQFTFTVNFEQICWFSA